MELQSQHFREKAADALADSAAVAQRDKIAQFTPIIRDAAMQEFGSFEALRKHIKRIRQHSLDNLDYYLARFELEATNNGNQVHYADTPDEMNSIVLDICQQHGAHRVAKGKSMVTEETALNDYLQRGGLEVVETDLGEYIIQQAGETPSHIVAPALHKSKQEIRELFLEKHALGERALETTEDLVDVLIICTTLDRILPRGEDATAMQRLLARSTTGQAQTSYTSFYSGPRREGELDGPLETHIVLLDNQRTDILASDYKEMLQCIRCGTCLNHCPVFAATGGHSYGWVYSGPMGSILTPLLTSLETSEALPNACTSCGRCGEVCPADIPLPDLLRDLRHEQYQQKMTAPRWRVGLKLHAWLAVRPSLYQFLTAMLTTVLHRLGRKKGSFSQLPFAAGWTSVRDFPAPQSGTFMQQYKARTKADE